MPRVAGSSHVYTFQLRGLELAFPSVTHILHFIGDEWGVGPMAWWGYEIGARAAAELYEDDWTEVIADMKETEWTPNKVRDVKKDTGTNAHQLLESLAIGEAFLIHDGENLLVKADDPMVIVKILGLQKRESAKKKWLAGPTPDILIPTEKLLGAALWWEANRDKHNLTWSELVVVSLKYGFAGSLDFGRNIGDPELEIPDAELVDYKSHKPAQGIRKDGSYPEGKGCAYFTDMAQQRAYGQAAFEMGIFRAIEYRTVLVPEDGKFYEDTRRVTLDDFLDVKAMHDRHCRKEECRRMARIYGRDGR